MVAGQSSPYQESNVDESTLQLVIDQLEELVATIIEEVRERPAVVVAIGAAVVGAAVGSRLARGMAARRSRVPAARAIGKARRVGDMAQLAGLVIRLLQNPIVRGLVLAALERQIKRRVSH
jgi:hypothetical protein